MCNKLSWCVANEFSAEENGSCKLFAAPQVQEHKNMNDWYAKYDPPRAAMASDCEFICDHAWWAKSWCAAHEFSTEDNGNCRLSSCQSTPAPSSLPVPSPTWQDNAPDIDWSDEDTGDAALGAGGFPKGQQQQQASNGQRANTAARAVAEAPREGGGGDEFDDPTIQTLEGDDFFLHGVGVFEYASVGSVASQVYLCPSGACTAAMMRRGECPTFISGVAVRTAEHTVIMRGSAMHLDGTKLTPTGSLVYQGDGLTVTASAALSPEPHALTPVDASREPPRLAHELRRSCKHMSGGEESSSHICGKVGWRLRTGELSIDVGVVGPYEQGWLKEGVSDRTFLLNVSAVKGGERAIGETMLRGFINGAAPSEVYFNVPDGDVLFPADQKKEMDAQCGAGQALRLLNAAGASTSDIRRFREPPTVYRARLEDVHSVSDAVSDPNNTRH